MKVFVLLSFILSFNLQAEVQCLNSADNFSLDLKNDSNGSLQDLKTQDQDGLGTCYANSMSVMLQSWTGRPVSYHQLAMAYGLDRFFVSKANNINGDFFSEGGDSCTAFEALRERDKKLCQKKDVLFENLINSNDQEIYLKKIGEFYDVLQGLSSSEAKEILSFIKKASRNAKAQRIEECKDEEKLKAEALEGLNELSEKVHKSFFDFYQVYDELSKKVKFSDESLVEFEKYRQQADLIGHYKNNNSENEFIVNPEVKKKLETILLDLKVQYFPLKTFEEKNKFFEKIIVQILGENSHFKNNFSGIVNVSTYLGSKEDFNEFIVNPILSYSSPDYCLTKEHKRIFQEYLDNDLECIKGIDPKISEFLNEMSVILSDNYDDLKYNDGFFEQFENSNKGMDSFFMGLINK